MTNCQSTRRAREHSRPLRAFALAAGFATLVAVAPTAVRATPPTPVAAVNAAAPMEIGPLAPLTTGWHSAGSTIHAPIAAALTIRQRHSAGATVKWEGASVAKATDTESIARVVTTSAGQHVVNASVQFEDGEVVENRLELIVVDAVAESVTVQIDPLSDELLATTPLPLYGGDLAIDTHRSIGLSVTVHPPELADLVEWRFDGRSTLGPTIEHRFRSPGIHQVAVGPHTSAAVLSVESYRVDLQAVAPPKELWDYGDPIELSFLATTVPSGYEDYISWSANTANGQVSAPAGQGSIFSVVVSDYVAIEPCGKLSYAISIETGSARFAVATEGDPCKGPCDEEPVPTDG